ncbi:mucin-17-like [Pomacea canaliculata]|uniref:mucin-17-like n=1 Tax=Pomacea canaliculata TaxID=400727 RepID=UPI000D727854|nr:mucin-17-like [Pomacea canaliculata]
MVVTVMMVMLHCVVVHSASSFPTGAFRSPKNDNQEVFNFPDITSGVSSGSTLVEDREKESIFSADQPLTPAGSASNQAEEGSSPDRQTGQDVSLTDTTNINSVLSSGVQELTSEILDATRLSEGGQLSNAPNTTTKKYDGPDGVSGSASSVGRDELPVFTAEPILQLDDERKTDSVEIVTDSSLDDDENVNENEFPTGVSDRDEALLSTPEDMFTQTSEDVVSLLNTVNDDSDLFTLPQTSMAPAETPESDMKLDSQDSLSSSVEPFATSNDVMSWSATVKRSTMKSELPLSSGKEALYTKSDSFSFSANPMQGSQRTRRESLSTGSAQSKTEDPNITGETEWTKEAAILYTALDTSADPTKNPPAPEDIDGTKESPVQASKELTIGPDGVSRDPGNDDSQPSGAVRGSPDSTEAPDTATAILLLGRSSEESSAGASEGVQTVSEANGSTKQEKTALGDVTAAVRSSETAADSSSRDVSSVQKVSDVHSTGEQYGTEVTKSDEHSRTSDALTSQSDVPDFATTRSDKKGQGKGSSKRSPNTRVTPVRTTKVRRETQGESTLDNTQTTKSASEAELMTTSEHLTDDTSMVLTTTEMSTTTTATTTTTRRPLVLGDKCSEPSDCQKYINSSTCASGVCVCARGYFKKDSSCYAEPRNLTVTQRNDYMDIFWEGDNIEYTVYINISNKYNTTSKMFKSLEHK